VSPPAAEKRNDWVPEPPRAPTPEELTALAQARVQMRPDEVAQAKGKTEGESSSSILNGTTTTQGPRDDDCLPDSLEDSLSQSAQACCEAMGRGQGRCVVEILVPEFWDPVSGAVFKEEGDQQRFWRLTRRFVDQIMTNSTRKVRVIYPDIGVAAMLKNMWTEDQEMSPQLGISSLNDRVAFDADDEVLVIAAPDPQGLESVIRITNAASPEQAVILFNPRLASGDVGVGLNVRRMRDSFLSSFVTAYSLRPIDTVGSVFRRYPGLWQVFVEDPEAPGRYKLIAEEPKRPAGEYLDSLVMKGLGIDEESLAGSDESNGVLGGLTGLMRTVGSLNRFMKSLSK